MRPFRCPECGHFALFESQRCGSCGTAIGFQFATLTMVRAPEGGILIDGHRWLRCSNWGWGCNWVVAADSGRAQCFAESLIRRRPDADDTIALEKLAATSLALRRLLMQLKHIGLPIEPYYERSGGLAFDLVSSYSNNEKVIIGHANGVITIDLAETLDAHREALRVRLGEPYRTMLGHFRHEVGHYYEWILVESGPLIGECRELFGDERISYSDEIQRHYKFGPPADWQKSFISEYATMHPWEDFAETFAHYLHITNTLATAAATGVVIQADRVEGFHEPDVIPRLSYADAEFGEMLSDWRWLSLMFNRVNRAMGKSDLYPFTISEPVAEKLGFVHRVVCSVGVGAISPLV